MAFSLPEIQISSNFYTALKIIFLVAGFIVIVFNVLSVSASLPPNTTDWNFGIELTDDDKEEEEEEEDEREHAEEEEEK